MLKEYLQNDLIELTKGMWLFIDFNVNVLTVRPKFNFDLVGVINRLKSLMRFVPKTVIV